MHKMCTFFINLFLISIPQPQVVIFERPLKMIDDPVCGGLNFIILL